MTTEFSDTTAITPIRTSPGRDAHWRMPQRPEVVHPTALPNNQRSAEARHRIRAAVTLVAAILLSACSSVIHKTDKFSGDNGAQALSIDAKQRVVIFTKPKDNEGFTVACAEPSPDALTALSSAVGTSAETAKAVANLSVSNVESAASIGLRTQSIQLLRDGMYRLCEAYAANAITKDEFKSQQRRYQNLMLSLLAIEQLTGAVTPRQVGLGSGSSSSSIGEKADQAAGDLAQTTADLKKAQEALAQAEAAKEVEKELCETDTTACARVAAKQTEVDGKQVSVDELKEKQATAKQVLRAARAAATTTAEGGRVSFAGGVVESQVTDVSARYIAEATRVIVSTTLLASFAQEECSNVWEFINKLDDGERASFLKSVAPTNDPNVSSSIPAGGQGETLQSQIVHMAKNCASHQAKIMDHPSMFTPLYGATPAPTLQVLVDDDAITLAAKDKASFTIVGGVPRYRVSDLPPALSKDLTAEVAAIGSGIYVLTLERPATATMTAGNATVYVTDGSNTRVSVPIKFVAKAN